MAAAVREEGELTTSGPAQDQGGTGTTAGVIVAMGALAVITEEMTPSGSRRAPQPGMPITALTSQ